MKHIKNISELKSSTYQSAADALKGKGHHRRVGALQDWAKKRKLQEIEVKKKQLVDRIKSIGTFELYFVENIILDCYLHLTFNKIDFLDNYQEWIHGDREDLYITLYISALPVLGDDVAEDSYKRSRLFNNDKDELGFHHIGEVGINLGSMPETTEYFEHGIDYAELSSIYDNDKFDKRIPYPISPMGRMYKDNWHGYNWEFSNRREAAKFRKALIDIFRGNVNYDSTSENPGGLKEQIMDFLISDYDIIDFEYFEEWITSLGRINVNRLYKD